MNYNHSYADAKTERSIKFKEIKVNARKDTICGLYKNGTLSKKDLGNIYEDMLSIRYFEEMLSEIKEKRSYSGKDFFFEGPCHLAIGQETTAVAEAFYLDKNDFIFGSHRNHHEVLAKGFSAVRKMTEEELTEVFNSEENIRTYEIIRKNLPSDDVCTEARRFFLFGILCDIFAKKTGFCGGLSGSMHLMFPPFGIYPSNAIVGASASIGAGAALFKKTQGQKGVVIVNIGDGSAGRGPVFEALNFSSMKQFETLWDERYKGGLPVLFNFSNNFYGMNADTENETMSFGGDVSRVGAFAENGLNAEKIDGWNIAASLEAYKEKIGLLKNGKGPCLTEAITYRLCGHSVGDREGYRNAEEVDEWKLNDPLAVFPKELEETGIFTKEELEEIKLRAKTENDAIFFLASDEKTAPYINFEEEPDYIKEKLFNKEPFDFPKNTVPETLIPKEELTRVKEIKNKRDYEIRDAVFEALLDGFYSDPTFIACGEDIRDWNTSTSVYGGLEETLPRHRFFNAPISEAAMVGAGVGYAMCGGKILIEMMYSDFIGCAGDEIINQAAKWQSLSFGRISLPLILHIPVGYDYGAQHSQDLSSFTAMVPGLKTVYPVTPSDAKNIMAQALKENNPVMFFESKRLRSKNQLFKSNPDIKIGKNNIICGGSDLTVVSVGATLYRAAEAVRTLKEDYGVSAELIDAVSLVPFDYETVVESVKKTKKILFVSDAAERGSFLKELSHNVTNLAIFYLEKPPAVLGAKNHIVPALEYDGYHFPQVKSIIQTVNDFLIPLGLENKRTAEDIIEEARKGL